MVRNSETITCSITKEQGEFLSSTGLSASSLLQTAIEQQKEVWRRANSEVANLQKNIGQYQKILAARLRFIEYIGKEDDFKKWHGEQDQDEIQ